MTLRKLTSAIKNGETRSTFLIVLSALLLQSVLVCVILPDLGGLLSSRYGTGFENHGDLYDVIASNLAHGNGYRVEAGMSETMMREPGYPLFLVAVFKLGGYRIEAIRIANILLAGGIAFLLMRLTQMVTGDGVVALLAAVSFLFYPSTIISEARGGVEVAFTFVVLLFMVVLHSAVEEGDRWRYFLAGLALGAAVLVRSTPLLFPVCVLAYLLLVKTGWTERLRAVTNMVILGVGLVLAMSPWVIRNYRLVHQVVPTATVQGVAAQEGQYTCRNLSREKDFQTAQQEAAQIRNEEANRMGIPFTGYYYQSFYSAQDEVAFNKSLLRTTGREYRQHPALLAECAGKNLLNFWFLGKTWQVTGLNVLIQLPLLTLALTGIFLLWKRSRLREIGIVVLFVLYVVALHAPIIAHARHSVVLVPFLAIFSSVALKTMWSASQAQVARAAVPVPATRS